MKDRFHVPDGTYLLSHSVGCLPANSAQILAQRYVEPWHTCGGDAWPVWLQEIERFRGAIARLLGAESACVCPTANLSSSLTKILHGMPGSRVARKVLMTQEDFPSLGFVVTQAARYGFEPVFLPGDADPQDPAVWRAALDGPIAVALITHAFSNRSARLPVGEIAALCRQRGVFSVVDVAQTAGVLPINVTDWQVDFVIGSCVKFLCGGPGAGFLWIAERLLRDWHPVDVGWFSHENPFEFDIRHFRYAADALRFWGGTPAIAPYVQAAFSAESLLGVGIETISAHNQQWISALVEQLPAARLVSVREPALRGNTVLVRIPDLDAAQARMRAANIRLDARQGCLRLAPHLYNDSQDLERLLAALNLK